MERDGFGELALLIQFLRACREENVEDRERALRLGRVPTLIGDFLLQRGHAFGGGRMRAEIFFQRLRGDLRQFLFRRARGRRGLLELRQTLHGVHAALRRITGGDGEFEAAAIGFEFLLLGVARLEEAKTGLTERVEVFEAELAALQLDLYPADRVAAIHVGDFMAENGCEFIFGVEQAEQAAADDDLAAGESFGVHEIIVGDVIETVSNRSCVARPCDAQADLVHVLVDAAVFVVIEMNRSQSVARRHLLADLDFFTVADARGRKWNALELFLGVRDEINQRARTDFRGNAAALELAHGERSQRQTKSTRRCVALS